MIPARFVLPLLLSTLAQAADDLIALNADQIKAAAIAVAPLDGMRGEGGRRLPAQAVVPPARIEVVGAPLAGLVTAVKVAYGDAVRRGQVLARVQGPALLELQREFGAARAQADVAAENRRRDETLFADGIVSRARLAATEAADRQAQALLAEKRAALGLAGLGEPRGDGALPAASLDIRAPFDGVVLEAPVAPGSRVDATAMLFKLGRLAPLWLEIQASPAQAAGLAPGDKVSVPGCAGEGRLTLVVPQLSPATQSLLLRAEIPNKDGCLKPFQFGQALIQPARPAAAGVFRVPNAALVRHQGQAWLFAETPGGLRPLAVRVVDEAERTTQVAARDDAAPLRGEQRIVVKGVAAVKAAWLGLGAGEAH